MSLGPQFSGFTRYYHGTSERNVESIMKEGLKQSDPSMWLRESGQIGEDEGEDPGHPTGVYLGDKETASGYGDAVFSVDLPNKHSNWGWTESEGSVWQADIPPMFLTREQ